ncbi:MAG: HAD hydrolase-like protein, partial [Aestuariivirgaceae bacterium]
ANPDKVVRKGARLVPCAGALADIYTGLGGSVQMAGKPYAPIYRECLRQAAARNDSDIPLTDVLAIGDGLSTDVRGAADFGIDILFIVTGIHEYEMDGEDAGMLVARITEAAPGIGIAGIMTGLR